jgi:alpha-glucoside transport system substrate-binding protein
MKRYRPHLLASLLVLVLALFAAACGGSDDDSTTSEAAGSESSSTASSLSGSISVMGVWTGAEQANLQAVLKGFTVKNPDVTIKYTSAGDQLPTQLSTAVAGGNPPSMAFVAQPGLMKDLVAKDALKPITYAAADVMENLGQSAVDLGTVDGTLYGFLFKAANKSTVWYNVKSFEDAGVEVPATWDDFLADAKTINASGLPAYSIAGADGWTLTDLFENIYLRQAGAEKYDQLAAHEIPWTDQSVKDALAEVAKVFSDTDNIAGGSSGALETDFPTSVSNVFSDSPKAAMVAEGDFVAGAVETTLAPETGYNVFPFPEIGSSGKVVVGGGDTLVTFEDTPAVQALVEYLTTPAAAAIWAAKGGFATLNRGVEKSIYPDPITQQTAGALGEAEVFRFDLSDLQPAAFGGTVGQGMWKLLQDFLKNPSDIDGTATQLEAAANKAFS